MDLDTQLHLKPLRQALAYRLHELSTQLHAAELARCAAPAADMARVGPHEQQRIDEAASIQAALRRLDNGCYGDCQLCSQPIALQRLRVHPEAERCAACESAARAAAPPRGP